MRMANNLEIMIAKSGMTKKHVAQLKGITPETLSRHVHGKIQMTLQDAEQYAKVLDCAPQDILFAQKPKKIIGYMKFDKNDSITRVIAAGATMGKVYLHNHMQEDTAAILYSAEKGYAGYWSLWKNAVAFVKLSPITAGEVDPDAIMNSAYVKVKGDMPDPDKFTKDGFICGVVYPEPGGTYTVHDTHMDKIRKGLSLEWATPLLAVSFRPELRNLEIVLERGLDV